MIDVSSTALAAAAKQQQQDAPFIRVLELTVPTSPKTVLRLANYDRDVQFGNTSTGQPITYMRFPFAMGEFRETRTGDLAQVTISVCNVTRELMAYIDAHNAFIGEELTMRMLLSTALTDNAAQAVFNGEIVACEVDARLAVFSVGQPSLNQQVCPSRRFLTDCGVITFGDSECGYLIPASPTNVVGGGFDHCPRHIVACRERGDDEEARGLPRMHPRRMNACPGVQLGNL